MKHTITLTAPSFNAAHSGLHDGQFEPLHGHTFTAALRVTARLDTAGMIADFTPLKAALAEAVAPLKRRTLMPGRAPAVTVARDEQHDEVHFSDGSRRFVLPAADVVVLPLVNTTTELLAAHLLDRVLPLPAGITRAELCLAESPTAQATAVFEPESQP